MSYKRHKNNIENICLLAVQTTYLNCQIDNVETEEEI